MATKPSIKIINVPSDIGSMIKGKSLAPDAFSKAGLEPGLRHAGYTVATTNALSRTRTWHIDGTFQPHGVRNEEENVQVCHEVKAAVSSALSNSKDQPPPFLLVIGGECNIAPAIMSALWEKRERKVGLIYVDGDADLSIPGEAGSSGNLASMTMTHLTMRPGALQSMKPFTRPDGSGVCDSSNTALFGLNSGLQSNSRDQIAYLFDEGFRVFTSSAIEQDPVRRAEEALNFLLKEKQVDSIFVLFDVDSIDGSTFPLANVPNRTGAGFEEILAAIKVFLKCEKVCGMVVTEVNPDHDPGTRMLGRLIDELVDGFRERLDGYAIFRLNILPIVFFLRSVLRHEVVSYSFIGLILYAFSSSAQFNNPPGVDIWCGKAYRATNASFNPGGQFEEPSWSVEPLLSLKVTPRMSIYLDDEKHGSFLVNASISHLIGSAIESSSKLANGDVPSTLSIDILLGGKSLLGNGSMTITLGSVAEVSFDLSSIPAKEEPYNITAKATSESKQTFTASTQLIVLPVRKDNGTAVRIDNFLGGLAIREASSKEFKPFFPYTYYVQWDLYFNTSVSTIEDFSKLGYNVLHIVPTGSLGDVPFPWDESQPYLDKASELGLYFQYDVLYLEHGISNTTEQVNRLKSHPSILSWYIADEPDGKSVALNSTHLGYEKIRSLDLYHPISMALNCYDFHYQSYASGADIIMTDVYPISTNTSWSNVYDTVCNSTYGCCGCDDCNGVFEDISDRLEHFYAIDDVIGWQKTHWTVPQAFGNETFWTRYPTAAEEIVMNAIAINHGAKGSVMWDFPTTEEILEVTNRFARILTSEEFAGFVLGEQRYGGLEVKGAERIDASAWVAKEKVFVIVINLNYGDQVAAGNISIELPEGVHGTEIEKTLWGDVEWSVDGNTISTPSLKGLETSMFSIERS
ncbi:Arginase [Pseudocercospora fuligena]|uniref:Arginase n=1 Tax=Pseudocercospora fuligena TaxID=685502 RepID=A0A8H6VM66_9PEZI|nr:Arginase [Pseudocercospora fuligena]